MSAQSDEFDWVHDDRVLCMPGHGLAAYCNAAGGISIKSGDSLVALNIVEARALFAALPRLIEEVEEAGRGDE